MPEPNPFIVGEPLSPEDFSGHGSALDIILGRLGSRYRASTSVVGWTYTGRTTLLRYLTSDLAKREHRALEPYWPILFSASGDRDLNPRLFWVLVLRLALEACADEEVREVLASAVDKAERGRLLMPDLSRVVDEIGRTGNTLLLAIDDFHLLMSHPSFIPPQEPQFFDRFRNLCQRSSNGFAMVVTTPRPLLDLWKYGSESPFYNIFTNANIGRLSDGEVEAVVERQIRDTGVRFTTEDFREIRHRSENLPVYVQYYAGLLYCAHVLRKDAGERRAAIEAALGQEDNAHVTITRHLLSQMAPFERRAFDKLRKSPTSLSAQEKQVVAALEQRGGLPPGVEIP